MLDAIIDGIFLRSQAITASLAVVAVALAASAWRRRTGAASTALAGLGASIGIAVASGRLAWLLTTARPQLSNPIDVIRANTGIDMVTTAWVFAISAVWFGKRHKSPLPQFAAWALLVAPAIYAAGCLLRRDCAGRTAPAPFGVAFDGYSALRLPIGLYEALALAVAFIVLIRFRDPSRWSLFGALAAFGLIEWAIEFGRIEQLTRATFGLRSMWLLSSFAAACLALFLSRTTTPTTNSSKVHSHDEYSPGADATRSPPEP